MSEYFSYIYLNFSWAKQILTFFQPSFFLQCIVFILYILMIDHIDEANGLYRCRTSLAANPEELVGVDSPLREASPRPEVRVVAPSHRPAPTSVLAANGGHHHHHHAVSTANRKSVSILLPEQTSG